MYDHEIRRKQCILTRIPMLIVLNFTNKILSRTCYLYRLQFYGEIMW